VHRSNIKSDKWQIRSRNKNETIHESATEMLQPMGQIWGMRENSEHKL